MLRHVDVDVLSPHTHTPVLFRAAANARVSSTVVHIHTPTPAALVLRVQHEHPVMEQSQLDCSDMTK